MKHVCLHVYYVNDDPDDDDNDGDDNDDDDNDDDNDGDNNDDDDDDDDFDDDDSLGWQMDTIELPSANTFVMNKLAPDFIEQRR